ncbi:hypothetical protein IV203_010673 [Nitzschia inconspicua]|uniref:Uncharacterized protein n=1 Tax=Nitzschia inconspicua TaxID=303405 RepID=A0A9K3PL38_9STRA|nr:hypothetical protein IV203_010673 [Nitzschia inconspicua]
MLGTDSFLAGMFSGAGLLSSSTSFTRVRASAMSDSERGPTVVAIRAIIGCGFMSSGSDPVGEIAGGGGGNIKEEIGISFRCDMGPSLHAVEFNVLSSIILKLIMNKNNGQLLLSVDYFFFLSKDPDTNNLILPCVVRIFVAYVLGWVNPAELHSADSAGTNPHG